jgi:tetratricopeptide (TPR) repeat protein
MHARKNTAFVRDQLPWIVAAVAFLIYLVTLNRWLSLSSLPAVNQLLDPHAAPPLTAPLHFLLTYPLLWLPGNLQLLGLNVLAAILAALTLALLARSVAILPHDRTRDQRHRQRTETAFLSIPGAWVPPIFAVAICGLHLAFWEHATAGTGEMLDLLLLAYLVRCLLEYRVEERESWLVRMALVYGLATANNYAMIAYAPAFLVALIWIRGLSFFHLRFLLRLSAWTLAGLSLYLLLPLVSFFSQHTDLGFWQALRTSLALQKQAILGIPRYIVLFGSLTSLLPLLFIGIRWPSSFGDVSVAGNVLTNLMFRVVHALFLVACLWVVFDAPFSARVITDRLLRDVSDASVGLPFLGFHYLGALAIGYFVGYFLLLASKPEERTRHRHRSTTQLLHRAALAVLLALALVLPAVLAYRNLPAVLANNGTILRQYAERTARTLPEEATVLISDSPLIHTVVNTWMRQNRASEQHLVLDTRLLPYAAHQRSLRLRVPELVGNSQLPEAFGARVPPLILLYQVADFATRRPSFYLHPSFGYYFEPLYHEPHGLTYLLHPYQGDQIHPPDLAPALIQSNQQFWAGLAPDLERLIPLVQRGLSEARTVGKWYSRSLVQWGVVLQRSGQLEEAADCFSKAASLNPDNIVARINLEYNESLQRNAPARVELSQADEERFGPRFRTWDGLLAANGPVDEPGFCFRIGQLMIEQSLYRQAAHQFARTLELEPDNLPARFWLGSVYLSAGLHQTALDTASQIRPRQLAPDQQIELARLEAMARFGLGDAQAANTILEDARRKFPTADRLFEAQADLHLSSGQLSKALQVIEEHLQVNPANLRSLVNKAVICLRNQDFAPAESALSAALRRDPQNIQALLTQSALFIQTQRYPNAVDAVNRVLALDPQNEPALMNRAIARLQSGDLDAAKQDYLTLHKRHPDLHTLHYGLAEIARQQKDIPTAIQFYQLYLQHAPADTDEAREVAQRLNQLQP